MNNLPPGTSLAQLDEHMRPYTAADEPPAEFIEKAAEDALFDDRLMEQWLNQHGDIYTDIANVLLNPKCRTAQIMRNAFEFLHAGVIRERAQVLAEKASRDFDWEDAA